ncbi:MAG: hypothetical protein HYT81_13590 [Gemmatimonadetes bacterium]|nr:hypothetical protein [Gemmatimonadota bacterium]
MRTLALVALAVLLPRASARSQQDSPAATNGVALPPRVIEAARLADSRVEIDGHLDEPAWSAAQEATDFLQFQPNPGAPASQRTVARVLYDDGGIYVAARLFDSDPSALIARLARRDEQVFSDWFYVLLDSYHDRRTGFAFGVNPRGVKVDLQYSEDVRPDAGWDAVWDVATAVDAEGWTAEFRIPLSQLRFSAGAATWGVNFRRHIARLDEISDWSPVPRGGTAFVSAAGELTGLSDLKPRQRLEVQPYVLTGVRQVPGDIADPFYRPTELTGTLGADLKYGVTSDLTLSLTLNPDFGQVEADPSVVNLSGFETFFPERRPFFLEGAEIFRPTFPQFPAMFHTRRIGRPPQGSSPNDAAYAEMPEATTILGAGKLTGKTAAGWSIGVFDAVTAAEHLRYVDPLGLRGSAPVEPLTNYGVLRVARDYSRGQTILGALATTTHRALPATGELDFLPEAAYVVGADGLRRFGGGRYEIAGSLFGSRVLGSAAAIDRIQRNAVHRLQRPDATHLDYDPTRTVLDGYNANLNFQKRTGHLRLYSEVRARSPGFEANDLGYLGRADQISSNARLWYDQFRPGRWFRSWQLNVSSWGNWSFGGERQWTGVAMWGNAQLKNFWTVMGGTDHSFARLDVDALRGGPALAASPRWWRWFRVSSDPRKAATVNAGAWQDDEVGTDGGSLGADAQVEMRPSNRLSVSLGPSVSRDLTPDQFVTNRTAGGETHYVRARLNQTTASLTLRAGFTFTPTLSLQLYGQPFVSAGDYSEFGRIVDPEAATLAQRLARYHASELTFDESSGSYRVDGNADGVADFTFGNPAFTFREFRSNAVLRWEYRPGSTLFVVWSQGRQLADGSGRFRLGRDVADLFGAEGTKLFTVKLSYWIGR